MKKADFYRATMNNGVSSFITAKRLLISPAEDSFERTVKLLEQQDINFSVYLKGLELDTSFDTILFDALLKSFIWNQNSDIKEKFKELFLAFAYIQRSELVVSHIYPLIDGMEDIAKQTEDTKEGIEFLFLCAQTIHSYTLHKEIEVVTYATEALDRILELRDIEPNYQANSTIEQLTAMFDNSLDVLTGDDMYGDPSN